MDAARKIKELESEVSELRQIVEAYNNFQATIVLEGLESTGIPHAILGTGVPPIGMRFEAHKHTTDGGTYATFEVVSHEWELADTVSYPDGHGLKTGFRVVVYAQLCDD